MSTPISKDLSSESLAGDKTVVEDMPLQSITVKMKEIDQPLEMVDGLATHSATLSALSRTVDTTTIKENSPGSKTRQLLSDDSSSPTQRGRLSQDQQQHALEEAPLASTSPSIASSWSRHPSVDTDSRTQIKAESVAMALRSFGGGMTERTEEDAFGRTRRSRDSSVLDSECSWSSTHESDEISEGSIHYPTISYIKASRISASQGVNVQPSADALLKATPHETPPDANAAEVGEPPVQPLTTSAVLPSPTPPPRPLKRRLRSQPAEGTSATVPESMSRAEVQDGEEERLGALFASAVATPTVTVEDELPQIVADATSVPTRESNPFEFGTGVSAASTPSGVVTLVMEDAMDQQPRDSSPASDDHTAPDVSGQQSLAVPGATLGAGLARELANRFSTTSEILRKHHIDDAGDQSYFPVVAADSVAPQAVGSPLASERGLGLEKSASPEPVQQIAALPFPVPDNDPSPSLPILASPISDNGRTPRVQTHGLGLEPQDNSDGWDILDHYADRSPPKASHGSEDSGLPRTSSSLENASVSHQVESPIVKKKASGILKIRTTPSNQADHSPQSVLTPTSVRTFHHASPEGSLSPDTHRFRAFAMHFPSPSQTPTKSTSGKLSGSLSGQKSSEATKLVQEDTLHGQLAMDLTSARNPVPINFLLVQSGNPLLAMEEAAIRTPPRQARGPLSPANGKHSPKAPSSPFFPSRSDKPRARSFSIVEVPLPLHRSDSSNSLQTAYAGILQNGSVAYQQVPEDDKVKRSLSRKGSAKLSAFRRKLSLRGEERPDVSSIVDNQPPLPERSRVRRSSQGRAEAQPLQQMHDGNENHSLPPMPSTPKVAASPASIRVSNSEASVPVSPVAKVANPESMHDSVPPPDRTAVPLYDEYGYLAKHSPVPPFAPTRISEKEVTKLEQTLVSAEYQSQGQANCLYS